jgi:hypothetical protein
MEVLTRVRDRLPGVEISSMEVATMEVLIRVRVQLPSMKVPSVEVASIEVLSCVGVHLSDVEISNVKVASMKVASMEVQLSDVEITSMKIQPFVRFLSLAKAASMEVFSCMEVGLPCMKIGLRFNLSSMEVARRSNRHRVFVFKIRHFSDMILCIPLGIKLQ